MRGHVLRQKSLAVTVSDQARRIIESLGLASHPEGGWFREIYRSSSVVETPRGARSAVTAIYYLLQAGQFSRWHVVESDEVWHFLGGEVLELITYAGTGGAVCRYVLGGGGDAQSVAVVPAGVWQTARPLGGYSLVGCTVAPGFDLADFRFVSALPDHGRHFVGELAAYVGLL